jgi:hypothetical protein
MAEARRVEEILAQASRRVEWRRDRRAHMWRRQRTAPRVP